MPGQVDEKDGLHDAPDPAGAEEIGEFPENAVVAGLVRAGGGHQVRNRDMAWYHIMMGYPAKPVHPHIYQIMAKPGKKNNISREDAKAQE